MGQRIDMFFQDPRLKIILMGDAPHWGFAAVEDLLASLTPCCATTLTFSAITAIRKAVRRNSPTIWGAA